MRGRGKPAGKVGTIFSRNVMRKLTFCCFTAIAVLSFVSVAFADAPPPSWYQVNQDGFGYGPTSSGTSLFVFDEDLYALNEQGWFRMENPITRVWTQLTPPNPPSGPGPTPDLKPFGDFLYAWQSSQLWWIAKGLDPNGSNWNLVTSSGLPGGVSPQPMTMFNGKIYGVYYNSSSGTFEIWRTGDVGKTTATWEQVVTNSFGDPTNNKGVDIMIVFNSHIYAGTTTLDGIFGNPNDYGTGVEIWESSSGDLNTWTQVNIDGFGTTYPGCLNGVCNFAIHQVIGSAAVYQATGQSQEYLYIGTKSHFGAEVWRYDGTGLNGWTNVTPSWAGPCQIGCGPGRNDAMLVFRGDLYLAEGYPTANLANYDGTDWSVVVTGPTPFDPQNGGLASLATLKDKLYVGTLHLPFSGGPTHGDQVWGYPFTPPVALCQDVTVAANGTCMGIASINNGSYDPDGDTITLDQSPPGPYNLGTTHVTLTVTDSYGLSSSCIGTVTVADTTPPTIGKITANPDVLWPPNHKMTPVNVKVSTFDNCDPSPSCKIVSVSSNEPVNGLGDGDTAPDWFINGNLAPKLRAERSGKGSGRIYTLNIGCMDASGNSSSKTAMVTVPKDQGKKK